MAQFTYTSKAGKTYDFDKDIPFEKGAFKNPSKVMDMVVKEKYPEIADEYADAKAERVRRLDKLKKIKKK